MPSPTKPRRNHTIDYLRGIAAVMVCFCHFRQAWPEFLQAPAKTYGELGVQIFFVISGYIIPYSLIRGGYQLADFGRFWLKRILRLQPALVCALGLTFALSVIAGAIKHEPATTAPMTLLKAAVYLGIPNENPVIWTLIVEVKYYLFVALLLPILFSRNAWLRRGAFVTCAAASILGSEFVNWWIHLPWFLIGFAGCYFATKIVGWIEFAALLVLAAAAGAINGTLPQLIAALATCAAILAPAPGEWTLPRFYGAISYSLYLIHFPVGVKTLNFLLPHLHGVALRIGAGFATLGVCTGVAWILYRVVEKPSSDWSQRVPLCGPRRKNVAAPSAWTGAPEKRAEASPSA